MSEHTALVLNAETLTAAGDASAADILTRMFQSRARECAEKMREALQANPLASRVALVLSVKPVTVSDGVMYVPRATPDEAAAVGEGSKPETD